VQLLDAGVHAESVNGHATITVLSALRPPNFVSAAHLVLPIVRGATADRIEQETAVIQFRLTRRNRRRALETVSS
jgi:hypothetical protein